MSFVIGFIGVNLFALLSPFLLVAAALWGTADEQEFMRYAFWVAFPLTVFLWYCVLHVAVAGIRGFLWGYRHG
jgi:hypothetical protein